MDEAIYLEVFLFILVIENDAVKTNGHIIRHSFEVALIFTYVLELA